MRKPTSVASGAGVRPAVEPAPHPSPPELAVVIPTLNEEETLPALLTDLSRLPEAGRIVVADGGSTDATVALAREWGAIVVQAPQGRSRQMNVGACCVASPWLLFLHADSRLPQRTLAALRDWLSAPSVEEAAHFAFRLDTGDPGWHLIQWGQRVRERLTGLVYGDQGLLVSRRRWLAMGGIPEMDLMEDVEAVRQLRKSGGIHRIDAPIVTSARRYRSAGAVRSVLRNLTLIGLYRLGVPPGRLARWYPPRGARPRGEYGGSANGQRSIPSRSPETDASSSPRSHGSSGTADAEPILLVFAKAPRAGSVKTRLARDLGETRATRLYRRIGRQVVDQVRSGAYRTRICFTPPDARAELASWLGEEALEFEPQSSGDLGARMCSAFRQAFTCTDRVCIVGTDAPDVHRALVEEALARLDSADAVFGPARDGGYYLLALRRPAPELFREIPWSTPRVLELSLQRAEALGLRVAMLPVLNDIDRVDDLPRELLEA